MAARGAPQRGQGTDIQNRFVLAYAEAANSQAHPELEMRISTDQGTWARFYTEYILRNPIVREEQSIIFLRNLEGKNSSRRVEVVLNSTPPTERVVEKTELQRISINGVTTVLAQERVVEKGPGDEIVHRIRLRQRYSTTWYESWSLDMTIVWTLTSGQLAHLLQHRRTFFERFAAPDTVADPRSVVDPNYHYEIEAEYKGDPAAVSLALLQQVAKRLESGMRAGTTDPEYLRVLREVSRLVNPSLEKITSFKHLFVSPHSFDREEYVRRIYRELHNYAVTDKADGERAFLAYLPSARTWVALTSRRAVDLGTDFPPPLIGGTARALVLDCECVNNHYYAFDLLCHGDPISDMDYDKRYERLKLLHEELTGTNRKSKKAKTAKDAPGKTAVKQAEETPSKTTAKQAEEAPSKKVDGKKTKGGRDSSDSASDDSTVEGAAEPTRADTDAPKAAPSPGKAAARLAELFSVKVQNNLSYPRDGLSSEEHARKQTELQERTLRTLLDPTSRYNRERPYAKDGIILTPLAGGYFRSTVYKYKPPEHQSVDFLVMRCPEALLGVGPYQRQPGRDLYLLFCGTTPERARHLGLARLPHYEQLFRDFTINYGERFPVHFAPAARPLAYLYWHDPNEGDVADLHGLVGEFVYVCAGDASAPGKGIKKPSAKTAEQVGAVGPGGVEDCHWRLLRLRPDKQADVRSGVAYGNDFSTADLVFRNYLDPLTVEELIHPTLDRAYFQEAKDPAMKPSAKFNAFVKAQIMRQLSHLDTVIDLASGYGQDLFVYAGYRVKHLVMVDRDREALETIRQWEHKLGDPRLYVYAPPPPPAYRLDLHIVEADLLTLSGTPGPAAPKTAPLKAGTPKTATLTPSAPKAPKTKSSKAGGYRFEDLGIPALTPKEAAQRTGANAVVMNFALHYFLQTTRTRDQLLDLIDNVLAPDGLLLFTCMDGASLFRLLSFRAVLEITEAGTLKYRVERDYTAKSLGPVGQSIKVKLPFSAEPVPEYLVNVAELIRVLQQRGYQLRQNASFGDWLGRFEQYWPEMAARLTDADRQYSSLYRYLCFKRTARR